MKLPNGYGSITEYTDHPRRKPYVVRFKGKYIGASETYEGALEMLAEYHKNPWDNNKDKTFSDVFDLLMKYKVSGVSAGTVNRYKSKYKNYCKSLYDIPYKDLRTYHFTTIIEQPGNSVSVKKALRELFRAMDKTAYEFDVIDKQYTQNIGAYTPTPKEKKPFSEEEIKILWDNLDIEDVDLVLILIYTGFRSGELEKLLVEDIDLEAGTLKGGIKTKAGKNRIVPIHPRIQPLIEERLKQSKKETLLNYGAKQFRIRFKRVMEKLNMSHIPHECRHTMRTRLDNLNINANIINLILGHQGPGTGERVYTHKTIKQLKDAVAELE